MFNKILCATDLNKENDPAITKAVQVAHQFNSSIIILNVHDEFMEKAYIVNHANVPVLVVP